MPFGFLYTSVRNISHCNKNSATGCHKCTYVFMQSTRHSCHSLMYSEFSQQLFDKASISNFMKIRPVEVHRETDMKKLFAISKPDNRSLDCRSSTIFFVCYVNTVCSSSVEGNVQEDSNYAHEVSISRCYFESEVQM